MRIIAAAGEFNLPTNFETQLTKYNVMLTSAGEQTNPITLPPTPNNLKLVGYSNRIDALYKSVTDIAVTISDGLKVRPGNLGIHTADDEDGISCTLYMGTADFYSRVAEAKLASLPWPIIKSPTYDSQTLTQRVQYLIDLLKTEYNTSNSNANFFCAPVMTNTDVSKKVNGVVYAEKMILNGFETRKYITPLEIVTNVFGTFKSYRLHKMEGEYEQTYVVDGVDTNFTIGYGMTPFLKLKYIIDFIFSNYGYTFDYTDFVAHTRFDIFTYVAVLNNVADAIYSGVLKYQQLVPDLTIKKFLSIIEKLYAGKFIINEFTKTVNLIRYADVLESPATINLTPYLSSKLKKSEFEPVTFSLIDTRLNDSSTNDSKVTTETIEIDLLSSKTVLSNIPDIPDVFGIKYIQIGSVIHKNSTLIVDGKTIKEEDKSMSELMLCDFPTQSEAKELKPPFQDRTVYYRRSRAFLSQYNPINNETLLSVFQTWYTQYINFYRHSNIPIDGKFLIPEAVLSKIDIKQPVLVESQKMLVETIKQPTGNSDSMVEVEIRFRTLRNYIDR